MARINLTDSIVRIFYRDRVPSQGTFKVGDRVINTNPTVGSPIGYWLRVSNGSEHIIGTDWIEK